MIIYIHICLYTKTNSFCKTDGEKQTEDSVWSICKGITVDKVERNLNSDKSEWNAVESDS